MQSKVPSNVEFKMPLTNVGCVRNFLSNLNESKSTGLDNIGPKILNISANIIVPMSCIYIINKSVPDHFLVSGKKKRLSHCSNLGIKIT